jgi:uncharacterized protein
MPQALTEELGVFALHTVLFPGQAIRLTVFEERYQQLIEDVLPEHPFSIVAIRRGQEVGGPYEPYAVGVRVLPEDHEVNEDGTYEVEARAVERIRLVERVHSEPYPVWRVTLYPESGEAGREAATAAIAAWRKFLDAAEMEAEGDLPEDPALLSYTLAAALPRLVPDHQALLELPGPAERLTQLARSFRMEAGLLRALKGPRES